MFQISRLLIAPLFRMRVCQRVQSVQPLADAAQPRWSCGLAVDGSTDCGALEALTRQQRQEEGEEQEEEKPAEQQQQNETAAVGAASSHSATASYAQQPVITTFDVSGLEVVPVQQTAVEWPGVGSVTTGTYTTGGGAASAGSFVSGPRGSILQVETGQGAWLLYMCHSVSDANHCCRLITCTVVVVPAP